MSEHHFLIQLDGRIPTDLLDPVSPRQAGVRLHTVLGVALRDHAEVDALLMRISALGLDLVEFRRGAPAFAGRPGIDTGAPRGRDAPVQVEVVVDGPLGDLGVSAVAGDVGATYLATRLHVPDRETAAEIFARLRSAGAQLECATYRLRPDGTSARTSLDPQPRGTP